MSDLLRFRVRGELGELAPKAAMLVLEVGLGSLRLVRPRPQARAVVWSVEIALSGAIFFASATLLTGAGGFLRVLAVYAFALVVSLGVHLVLEEGVLGFLADRPEQTWRGRVDRARIRSFFHELIVDADGSRIPLKVFTWVGRLRPALERSGFPLHPVR